MAGVRWLIIERTKSTLRATSRGGEVCLVARQARGNGLEVVMRGVIFMLVWIVLEVVVVVVVFGKDRWNHV